MDTRERANLIWIALRWIRSAEEGGGRQMCSPHGSAPSTC